MKNGIKFCLNTIYMHNIVNICIASQEEVSVPFDD